MTESRSPIDILKVLNKSNCRECGEATCLAFASKVFKVQKLLSECPHVDQETLTLFGGKPREPEPAEETRDEVLERFKERLKSVDPDSVRKRTDVVFKDGKLTVKVCGKDFSVDSEGNFSSEIHIHSWLTLPVLSYIIEGEGVEPSGNWVPFRELKGGKDWARFFEHRCEKPMKRLADTYPDFFADMLHIFAGRQVEKHFDSDISLVLYPLPRLPVLVCYWKPEDGLESDFHLFFDDTADNNLKINFIYILMTGFLTMLEKIALRHN